MNGNQQRKAEGNDSERGPGRKHRGGLAGQAGKIVSSALGQRPVQKVGGDHHDAGSQRSQRRGEEASMCLKNSSKDDSHSVERNLGRKDHDHGCHEIC